MLAFLNHWPLPRKILAAFSILALLVGGLAITSFESNRILARTATSHVERGISGLSELADIISDVKELRIVLYSYYNQANAADAAKLEQRQQEGQDALLKRVDAYAKGAGADFAPEVAELRSRLVALNDVNDRAFALRRSGDLAGTLELVKKEAKDRSHDAIDQTEKLLQMSRDRSDKANAEGKATSSFALALTSLLSLIAMGALAAIWYLIGRTVSGPMGALTEATTTLADGGKAEVPYLDRGDELGAIARAVEKFRGAAVARAEADARLAAEQAAVTTALSDSLAAMTEGDLTAEVKADFPPAYAELKHNFNAALASLRDLIGAVGESAQSIHTGSSEIAQASEDLARRTEANAASLEETTAAVSQIDERLRATAAASTRTVERADGAISTVSGGRAIAEDAVQAMGRVSESAKGIDSVIEGLDKIAFQTRVLAMNAAVEAGRAGEAGRGFAVVADLVSALAMRAEEEAGRARDQLTATQTDIVAAVEMVQKVDGALADISEGVGEVHALLGNMAQDNQAQATAISQISTAIGTMDQATQQNAAMVEETSAAARNLTSEVTALTDRASRFRVGATAQAPRRAPAPARVAKVAAPAAPARKPAAAAPYVSPVKALPAASLANGHDDWTSF